MTGRMRLVARVFIGVDPHKLSATIEVVDDREKLLATGRFATDKAGDAAMRKRWRGGRSTTLHAKAILASVRPRDLAGKTRRRTAGRVGASTVLGTAPGAVATGRGP
jgi:hypothetical protein